MRATPHAGLAMLLLLGPDGRMPTPEVHLTQLGYALPTPPPPAGQYLPARRAGNLLFVSGMLPMREGALTHAGLVGDEQDVEAAKEAARVCALNVLGVLKHELGELSRVEAVVQLTGYVAAVPRFGESPQVINGASELLGRVFGPAGQHARAAVAVTGLPKNATVELAVVVSIKESA